jgi:hypothetical protein
MKLWSWIKKASQIYFLNLVLMVSQMTAIGGVLPSSAFALSEKTDVQKPSKSKLADDAWMPPGFTVEDYRTVEQVNNIAEVNRKREDDRNVGKVKVEENVSSSSCRTQAANDSRRMEDITRYRSVVGAQGFDEICRLRQKLNEQTGGPDIVCGQGSELVSNSAVFRRPEDSLLQSAENKYTHKVGKSADHIDAEAMEAKRLNLKAKMDSDRVEVLKLRALVPEKEIAYERAQNNCQEKSIGCSQEQINELERLRVEYYSSVRGLELAEASYKKSTKDYEEIGRPLIADRGDIADAGADVVTNNDNMAESDALSTAGEGENGALSGPVYETNEKLKSAIDRYTSNAASFAEEKIAETARLEFANQHRGDYEFYELALQDFESSPAGGKQALSNLDVMAMASAATKKIKCVPKRAHDSKAYHIFRAASATYIAATIGDQGSYTDLKSCIKDEIFNEDNKGSDSQFETVEKALNSHTQMVDSMCMTVNPDPNKIPEINKIPILDRDRVQRLKEICDASAGTTCAPGQKTGCAPRSRETALEMYDTAVMIAQHELTDKRQLVATAEANVNKGNNKIKTTIKNILVTTALFMMHKMLGITFTSIGTTLAASTFSSWAAPPYFKLGAFHYAEEVFFFVLYTYFVAELIKWKNFTKKWERKLDNAREHTHLACNFSGPSGATTVEANQVAYATDTKDKAQKAYDKAQENVKNQINEQSLGALGGKSGFIMPKGLPSEFRNFAIKTYLKKYIKAASKSAFNIVFPAALATADVDTAANTETAVATGGNSTRSGQALGMAIGSSSFYQFVIKQNQDWQVQAFDASENGASGYQKNDNPVLYCAENGDDTGCIKEFLDSKSFIGAKYRQESSTLPIAGMPTPETRVKYLMAAATLVRENISGTLGLLDQAVDQRDQYVLLIEKMREQMNIKDQGNANQLEEKHVQKAVSCMKEGIGGTLEIDANCQCQKTNSCGTLQYPELGEFAPGVLAVGEDAVKGVTDKALSGKLEEANVETGNLSGNKDAVRRRITDNFNTLNKAQVKGGKGKIDFKKQARNLITEGRKQAYRKYANMFPANVKQEKYRGGLSNYYNDMNLGTKSKDSSKSNQPALAAVGNTKSGATGVASGLEGGAKTSGQDKDFFNFDFEYADKKLTAAERKSLEDQRALAAMEAKNRKESASSRYRHQRNLSLTDESNKDNNGINKDTKKNIFNIISSRYKKSAFPIFLKEQFIR